MYVNSSLNSDSLQVGGSSGWIEEATIAKLFYLL